MQGGHNWWNTLDKAYNNLRYLASHADGHIQHKQIHDEHTITNNYNDNVLGASTTPEGAQKAKDKLGSKFEIKDMGNLKYILGVRFDRDANMGDISLSQRSYLEWMLERFGFRLSNPKFMPLPTGLTLTESQSPLSKSDKHYMKDKPYREALGSLIWAQAATRPDLLYAMGLLARFQSNPRPAHWKALAHVMQYVNGTLDYRIKY